MFCPQCGFNNDQQSRHCSQCGAALQPPAAVQPPALQYPAPPPQYPPPPPQYPAPGAQPYYAPPPFQPGVPMILPPVPNYMTQAVLVTLFCCLPLGIVGIIRAGEVNKRLAANDYAGALAASKSTRSILWWGFGSGLVIGIIYALVQFANVANH